MKWFKIKKEKYSAGISPSPPKKKVTPNIDDIPESYSTSDSDSCSASVSPSCDPYWAWISPSQPPIIKTRKKMTKSIVQESPEEKEKREKLNVRDYKREVDL